MRGILSHGAYLPYRRLDRATIAAVAGTGGGKGTRTVASYDEDTTTLGVEAARLALRATDVRPGNLWFSTVLPAYLDKTNATAIHAALRLPPSVAVADFGGAVRSASGALRAAFTTWDPTLVVSADIRTGLPGSDDETTGGDGAAALLVGSDEHGPVLAELLGTGTATDEFLDRWRAPGATQSRQWEEKFGETRYLPLAHAALANALSAAGIEGDQVDRLIVTGTHARAIRTVERTLDGIDAAGVAGDRGDAIGNLGAAQAALLLSAELEHSVPGKVIVLLTLADGADAFVLHTTDALATYSPARPIDDQDKASAPVTYGKFLAWRGMLTPEPPRRPEPARPSASAAARSEDWKFGFVGSRDRSTGAIHMPPARVSMEGGAVDDMEPIAMADTRGTIVTYTVDKLVYSPSPPVVFAVIDFDGGGRAPMELTDVDPEDVAIGKPVVMTFRRLFTADGIHNYFWKARPWRDDVGEWTIRATDEER